MNESSASCSRLMARAFELARSALGTTSPNPAVGAVIAHGSEIVGEGATQPPGPVGGPHAEVMAMRAAGDLARGATMYVTLEPCAHHGRTPPCTDAIIKAGIARVVVAVGDPDAQVDGRGLERLRDSGIDVSIGDGAAVGTEHYEAYAHHRRSGRPFVTAKFAASLDGRIASTSGDSRWVSGPETLHWAHQQRPTFDAILVGVETIIVDNPQLTARPERWHGPVPQPLRVVLDSRGRTPLESRVLAGVESSATLIATTEASEASWREALSARGVDVAVLPSDESDGRVSLTALLEHLGQDCGVVSLLVEGGGEVLGSFFDQRLVDNVTAVVAPMIIGGDAQTAVRGRGAERMRDALRLSRMRVEQLGGDLLVTGYPNDPDRELEIRVRPAGQADRVSLEALLALADGESRLADELLAEARAGEAVLWLAAQNVPGASDDALGVAAVRFDEGARASISVLALRPDAPDVAAERLRASCEASASGRDYEWLTCSPSAYGPTASQLRSAGYRYFRRDSDGRELLIKRLSGGG